MKTKYLFILLAALSNAFLLSGLDNLDKNNSIFIYGTITTVDDEVYQGQMRWGKEEAFWFDMFNSSKRKNDNLKYLSDEELDYINDKDNRSSRGNWGIVSWNTTWGWSDEDHNHSFACQFGDIKSINLTKGRKFVLELKNGEAYVLQGGSNDIGAKIQIADEELGLLKMDWDRIKRVDFMKTPSNLVSEFGEALYGTVKTTAGSFTGYLQWDHDERLTDDELNGEYEDGDLDIRFDKIKKIEKISRGSEVTMNSGRKFKLYGSNDVNDDNRGIIVNMLGAGRVDIPWDEFEEITFENIPFDQYVTYDEFRGSEKISGSVLTKNGEAYDGDIIYDLDEKYSLEILDGAKDDIEHFYPFYNIKSIKPLNRDEARVALKNGQEMILEDKVDVTRDNDGVLVFSDNKHTYIPWEDIERLELN